MIVVIEGGVDLKPLATSIERNVVIMDQAGTAYFVKMIIRLGLLQHHTTQPNRKQEPVSDHTDNIY